MIGLAGLAVVVALAAPPSVFPEGRDFDGTVAPSITMRAALLDVMNAHRARRGLPPLRPNRKLNAAAEDRIRDMFDRGYFDHVAPDGTRPDAWARRRGYDFRSLGENLATGQRTARAVVDHWMRSKRHRATLLGKFEDAGIAVAEGSPTGGRRGYTVVALYARDR